MKLHPRELLVNEAEQAFLLFLCDFHRKHKLTMTEWHQILLSEMQSNLRHQLRLERHGDAEKPAGLE